MISTNSAAPDMELQRTPRQPRISQRSQDRTRPMNPPPPPRTLGRWHCRVAAMLAAAAAMVAFASPAEAAAKRATVLEIDDAIGPANADYVVRELQAAKPGETGIIILRMNTPGGLDTSMRKIISAILASPVPVATFVAPNGARAATAAPYIAHPSAL